jgi:hypothetical protein
MTTKRIAKFITSESVKDTEMESRNAKRTTAVKAIGDEAALEEAKARADDGPKVVRTESVSPEGIQVVNFATEDKPHAPLGADEFGMPILPTPTPVAAEAEATRITSVAPEPANGVPVAEPSTVPATTVKPVMAKKEKESAKAVKPKADTAGLFANFKAAKMVNPFKETVKDHKRFNAIAGADKFEDALLGSKMKWTSRDSSATACNSRVQKVTLAAEANPGSNRSPPDPCRRFHFRGESAICSRSTPLPRRRGRSPKDAQDLQREFVLIFSRISLTGSCLSD